MRKLILKNFFLFCAFMILDLIEILLERKMKESDAETLAINLYLLYLVSIIIVNVGSFRDKNPRYYRRILRMVTVIGIFIYSIIIIYFLNWGLLIPLFYK